MVDKALVNGLWAKHSGSIVAEFCAAVFAKHGQEACVRGGRELQASVFNVRMPDV